MLVVYLRVETRANFASIKIAVADDRGMVTTEEVGEQRQKSLLLSWGARVGRDALSVEPADVSDADRITVVTAPPTVAPDFALRHARLDPAILKDYVMVADVWPALGTVQAPKVGHSHFAAGAVGRAMDDDVFSCFSLCHIC